jgi:RNA polymerase sigma-70 factor (ECF subfamily)
MGDPDDAVSRPGHVEACGPTPRIADSASTVWLTELRSTGVTRESALARLHDLLLRIAFREVRRRTTASSMGASDLDDLAHQAAGDAMVAILAKLETFRGESRFTTWAYRFVVLEVASKLGRRYWQDPSARLDTEDWEQLPDRFGIDPQRGAEQRELIDAVRRAADETLTERQRQLFVAIVVNGVPLDAMVARSGSSRGAIYKTIFDARRKLRAYLVANGYLDEIVLDDNATVRPDKVEES